MADAIDVSERNLEQIIKGTRLPSGEPRGVGPTIQKKLDKRYPGWANLAAPRPLLIALQSVKTTLDALAPPVVALGRDGVMKYLRGDATIEETVAALEALAQVPNAKAA